MGIKRLNERASLLTPYCFLNPSVAPMDIGAKEGYSLLK